MRLKFIYHNFALCKIICWCLQNRAAYSSKQIRLLDKSEQSLLSTFNVSFLRLKAFSKLFKKKTLGKNYMFFVIVYLFYIYITHSVPEKKLISLFIFIISNDLNLFIYMQSITTLILSSLRLLCVSIRTVNYFSR